MLSKQDAGIIIDELRQEKGLSWSELAERAECPNVWLVSAVLGMHPVPEEIAEFLRKELELDDELVKALRRQPTRVPEREIATDPTIYRFHELVDVYGPALKALIHDEFGDGIMSAINCSLDFKRVEHPGGDRVHITIDGKYLPYDWVQSDKQ